MLNKLKIKNNHILKTAFFRSTYTFSITLNQDFDGEVSLKKMLKDRLDKISLVSDFKIRIVLPDNLSFIINDDLLDLELFSSNLEFILNKNSKLDYSLKTDSLKTCGDFCGDYSSCKKLETIKKELKFTFLGSDSAADIKIFLNGAGGYFFDLKTVQHHKASNSKSDLIIKAALSQNSNLRSDNLVRVAKGLEKVDVSQVNKNLLLGCFSKTICIPRLEVESDDVVCKHGAAVSKLDEELMFYLQSRGMDHCKARQALIKAFLN